MKTLYIFDMGGVLAYNCEVLSDIISYLNINEEKFFAYADKDLGKFIRGSINGNEFWIKFSKKYGQKVEEELFSKFFNPKMDERVKLLIRQLKDDSRVVCGTNTVDPHYDYFIKHGDYDIFNAVYASNKMGVSKPNPDFYWYILREEGIKPENTVFVDDTEENILSAQKIGINSILFADSDSLKQQIKTFNNSKGK
jgi:putative hydrolase of the HAD superfamily